MRPTPTAVTTLPPAGPVTSARIVAGVLAPTLAVGVIARRPSVFGPADRWDADRRAVRELHRLNESHGPGPVPLTLPGRSLALVLDADHVHRVLGGTPDPFTPANREKRGALAHFQPRGVLISTGAQRSDRRRFNEAALDTGAQLHQLAGPIVRTVRDEVGRLCSLLEVSGELSADRFVETWWRVVRRVVLGDAARDDHELSGLLTRLRSEANWGYLAPRRERVYRRFVDRLAGYVRRAEPGSQAGHLPGIGAGPDVDPVQQIPQWLFAFDPAGLVTLRALALLATHPEQAGAARAEIAATDLDRPARLDRLRAAVLESARLWPTTPAVLRDTTGLTSWPGGELPEGTGLLIYAPYFHRNEQVLPYAHRYQPDAWLPEDGHGSWPLIPFSEGPAVCPGQNLVLLVASTLLATVLRRHEVHLLAGDRIGPARPLPMTFSPYRLRFSATPRD